MGGVVTTGRPRTAFVRSLSSLVVLPDCNLIISLLDRGWGGRRRKSGRFKVVVKGRCVFEIENFGMGSPYNLTFLLFQEIQSATIQIQGIQSARIQSTQNRDP